MGKKSRYIYKVTNISFDDSILEVEVRSPRDVYRGRITGDKLKFKGVWKGYSGSFTLNFDD